MKRLSVLISVLILITLHFSLTAEGAGEAPLNPSGEPVTIQVAGLKGPTSIGMLPLFKNRPSFAGGIQAEYRVVQEPQIMLARIMSGEVDIAAVPINLAAVLYNKGVPYRFGAVTGDGLLYVVSSRKDISSMEDLRGRTIYCIAQGSTPEFILRYALDRSGIDSARDVTIDFRFDQVSITPQLVAGKIDLAVLPEPFVSIVSAKNPEVQPVIDLQKIWARTSGTGETYPITAVLVKAELMESNPEAVEAFFSEYSDAIDWVIAHPKETGLLAEEFMDMPAGIIASAVPRLNLHFQRPAEARPRVDELYRVLHSFAPASVGGSIPSDEFYE
ncbi:ABC transporter substrate-binding protein [Marispirochaeta aestuarii]|uniref:ABC transporter substrate-binding protein n=1 Tax=Marispirochaeta aestuarii TaxID=1963862 RepID=UPI0029C6BEB1|nr:ABC transporter substrate-binding protein [Marispirochaeta aestuarii]